uniref:Uncharacterized protein n=1 Tax=Aegilops tauschii subsp. strangulata TaxID=200361 RepID=A0A453R8L8_AEGTS
MRGVDVESHVYLLLPHQLCSGLFLNIVWFQRRSISSAEPILKTTTLVSFLISCTVFTLGPEN